MTAPDIPDEATLEYRVAKRFCLDRCDYCGWPLAKDRKDGCVEDDCSMRPLPKRDSSELTDRRMLRDLIRAMRASRDINNSWIRDWESIAEAAGEKPDIMATSLRGRIANMRAERDALRGECARLWTAICEANTEAARLRVAIRETHAGCASYPPGKHAAECKLYEIGEE